MLSVGSPGGSVVKNLSGNAEDTSSISGSQRLLKKEMVFLPGKSQGQILAD